MAAAWLSSIISFSGIEEINEQEELVTKADAFSEKELYIRSIPLYENALQYKTDDNELIEQKLLSNYYEYGSLDSYAELVEERDSRGTAQEKEYVIAADFYLARRDLSGALDIIQRGYSKYGTQQFIDWYDQHAYAYYEIETGYDSVQYSVNTNAYPSLAHDEEGWWFIDAYGQRLHAAPYEEATPFNAQGLAAVKENGVYYLIRYMNSGRMAHYSVCEDQGITGIAALNENSIVVMRGNKYSFCNLDFEALLSSLTFDRITPFHEGLAGVLDNGKWGVINSSGDMVVSPAYDEVALNSQGFLYAGGCACLSQGGRWYLINERGDKVTDESFSEMKAPEGPDWIAVKNDQDRWGFIDPEGNVQIECQYSDAHSFADGLAPVKNGDVWGYINRRNKLVIDGYFSEALPFHNGMALTSREGYISQLRLEYSKERDQ